MGVIGPRDNGFPDLAVDLDGPAENLGLNTLMGVDNSLFINLPYHRRRLPNFCTVQPMHCELKSQPRAWFSGHLPISDPPNSRHYYLFYVLLHVFVLVIVPLLPTLAKCLDLTGDQCNRKLLFRIRKEGVPGGKFKVYTYIFKSVQNLAYIFSH